MSHRIEAIRQDINPLINIEASTRMRMALRSPYFRLPRIVQTEGTEVTVKEITEDGNRKRLVLGDFYDKQY
jgi:hypothetical protein